MNTDPSADTVALYREIVKQRAMPTDGDEFPAGALPFGSSDTVRGAVPSPLSRLVGREQELESVLGCIASARLVTLTGPGGVGKTRLAIAAAEQVAEDYAERVRFVDLSPLSDTTLIGPTLAALFDLREEPGRSLVETLQDFLQKRSLLLVLDNCEHLIGECAQMAETLLLACPRLRIQIGRAHV